MATPISKIEGIGPVLSEKLTAAKVSTIEALLEAGATRKGRADLAKATGIDEAKILKFVNMADLFRLKGVGEEYAELLEAAGVDTVNELKNRVPANLHKKISEVNSEKSLVRQLPSESQVEDWVNQAKELPAVVTY